MQSLNAQIDDSNHIIHKKESLFKSHGRLNRLSFVAHFNVLYLVTLLIWLITFLFLYKFEASLDPIFIQLLESWGFYLGLVLLGFLLYVSTCLMIRRLHDCGHSGTLMIIAIIPIGFLFLYIYALFQAGTLGSNTYGPVRPSSRREIYTAWSSIILLILFKLMFIYFILHTILQNVVRP